MDTTSPRFADLPPEERLARKVGALGSDALLELDELAAYIGASERTAQRVGAAIPSVPFTPQIRRWRFGDVADYAKHLAGVAA